MVSAWLDLTPLLKELDALLLEWAGTLYRVYSPCPHCLQRGLSLQEATLFRFEVCTSGSDAVPGAQNCSLLTATLRACRAQDIQRTIANKMPTILCSCRDEKPMEIDVRWLAFDEEALSSFSSQSPKIVEQSGADESRRDAILEAILTNTVGLLSGQDAGPADSEESSDEEF